MPSVATRLRAVLLLGSVALTSSLGDACLPVDVRSMLKGEAAAEMKKACRALLDDDSDVECSAECFGAITRFQSERCYPQISQSQRLQPRFRAPLELLGLGHSEHTLASLQGRWYGLYPASGIELVEVEYDAGAGMLSGTKLTGNDFVRAGRVSWTVSLTSCKVVSSLWQGVYTPRWDPCKLHVDDSDHILLTLVPGDAPEETLSFVRASLPLLLDWAEPQSPTYGFFGAMLHCGLAPEDAATSFWEAMLEAFHHTHGTVLLDQVLMGLPLFMLAAWQLHGNRLVTQLLLVPVFACFMGALWFRLNYLGLVDK